MAQRTCWELSRRRCSLEALIEVGRSACRPERVLTERLITALASMVRYSAGSFQKASDSRNNDFWRTLQVEPPSRLCLYNDLKPEKVPLPGSSSPQSPCPWARAGTRQPVGPAQGELRSRVGALSPGAAAGSEGVRSTPLEAG